MPGVVLVTGAAGSLGAPLLPALKQAGWRTRALVHRRPVPDADEQITGSLADPTSLSASAAGADAVVHLAAVTHARREAFYRAANVLGTAHLLAAAERASVTRFVQVSTRAISPDGGGYSRSKLAAEELVRASNIEHVIVRLPEIYGAGGTEGIDEMLERGQRGAAIPVVGAGSDLLCPVHVEDAVGALVVSLSNPAVVGRTYTLAGDCHTARDVARACAEATGGGSRVMYVPVSAVRLAGLAARVLPLPLYPDQLARLRSKKPGPTPDAREDLDFRPRSLGDGLSGISRRRD